MLLLHQTGSVRVGEVVRYTLTYTPSLDRILPPPTHLHVKVRNTSAVPLRAAYLHGPYTLYAACYPSTFDPYKKTVDAGEVGDPDYEPQLKAGGSWNAKLTVPEEVRHSSTERDRNARHEHKSFTWIVEVSSQVLFSTTAAVHYEVLVGRDEKSVSLGLNGVVSGHGMPGKLDDHQRGRHRDNAQLKGVFSKAVRLKVEDTAELWDTPPFPELSEDEKADEARETRQTRQSANGSDQKKAKRKQRIHLVILTHGLHSNVGADMLFMKEQIDATAKQARRDARQKNAELRERKARDDHNYGREAADQRSRSAPEIVVAPTESADEANDELDEEQVLVRGFNGNAVKTERGIQYLGKRLAKYVLSITYPDQPYLPVKSSISQSISRTLTGGLKQTQTDGKQPSHKNSSIAKDEKDINHNLPYQITSISFVGHSLGGLIQTYAIAYIQKHSPEFFDKIQPVNFVALASPFLGLSNENPMYVKFALDFGLVGRTGQDLGLTWRAPTIARNGWGAMVSGFGGDDKDKELDPGAKPLLRILPTGPAHIALRRFRNRTVYSNVVNDGIVPLRTSCLLFLDWRGLGRVEKARRENGLVGTMVNWGFAEITGQNASAPRRGLFDDLFADSGDESRPRSGKTSPDPGATVPQADASVGLDDEGFVTNESDDEPGAHQQLSPQKVQDTNDGTNFWSTFTGFFRPHAGSKKPKQQKIYRRGQTMGMDDDSNPISTSTEGQGDSGSNPKRGLVRGSSAFTNTSENENLEAPPKTTVFESAGDLLNPPLPPKEFLLDPSERPKTIFHDRVYHPEDIPSPPAKRQKTFMRKPLSRDGTVPNQTHGDLQKISTSSSQEQGTMRIEEKIARAYHRDMSWRKVLVCLEPDAHNNLIVRRMFANAYGWPVIKHLCDTHFGYTAAAKTRDSEEPAQERARSRDTRIKDGGEEVKDQVKPPDDKKIEELKEENKIKKPMSTEDLPHKDTKDIAKIHERHEKLHEARGRPQTNRTSRTQSELRESQDEVSNLVSVISVQGEPASGYSSMHSGTAALNRLARQDSGRWSDRFFEGSEDDSDDESYLSKEIQRAKDRGQVTDFKASPKSTRTTKSTASSKGSVSFDIPGEPILPGGGKKVVAEPEQIPERTSEADIDTQTLSLTGVGLGKSLQEMMVEGLDAERQKSVDQPISEQVARAQSHPQG